MKTWLFTLLIGWPLALCAQEVRGPLTQQVTQPDSVPSTDRHATTPVDELRFWNQVAIDASGLDHTAPTLFSTRHFGEQLGPGRSSRAVAVVQIAVFDAVNAIVGGYQGYTVQKHESHNASIEAAIAQAAHDTLIVMWPSQRGHFDALLTQELALIRWFGPYAKENGQAVGRRAARSILLARAGDSHNVDPKVGVGYFTSAKPGHWQQDPISQIPIALGVEWGSTKPFVIQSGRQFRAPPPPALTSLAYAQAFDEVKRVGGDGVHTATERTVYQTETGLFWAYDGTPSLCAPPRLYNQLLQEISKHETQVIVLARLFALANIAMADASIAIWESKYHYDLWRPVTAIRRAKEDGNDATSAANYWPLGAPASNLKGPNFTPPFPAYPSGHAGFGGALFEVLREFYGTDRVAFTFVSDEFNGHTHGNDGKLRPFVSRSYASFSEAEEENGQSRIYLGIHWAFDKTAGIAQGRSVARYVMSHALKPVS